MLTGHGSKLISPREKYPRKARIFESGDQAAPWKHRRSKNHGLTLLVLPFCKSRTYRLSQYFPGCPCSNASLVPSGDQWTFSTYPGNSFVIRGGSLPSSTSIVRYMPPSASLDPSG